MHPTRILLVDDDHDHLLICHMILKRQGFQVKILAGCTNYDKLLETVESFDPSLIFMDHEMSGLCGADLTRWLKGHIQFNDIPIIYFSSRDDISELAKKAGANDLLRKPFKADDLVQISRRYLRNSA